MSDETNYDENEIINLPLTRINLPHKWILYLYDKNMFKKIVNRPNIQSKPHKKLCTISTVNDLVYILQLMQVRKETNFKTQGEINLDVNDYIIMREGIEPIWEDPKNSKGGTFTIKMNHSKGYEVWSMFVMYMLGETLTYEMEHINGITVSFISHKNFSHGQNNNNSSYTYLKIWDAKPGRTREDFINILPLDILERIKNESLMYSQYSEKKHYGEEKMISWLNNNRKPSYNQSRGNSFGHNHHRRRY